MWSEGHVWCSPEMHGTITGTFKNQIDWCLGKRKFHLKPRSYEHAYLGLFGHIMTISPSLICNSQIALIQVKSVKSHSNPRPKDGTKIMLWILLESTEARLWHKGV